MRNSLEQFLGIPWDCLSKVKRDVVYLYIYKNMDFKEIAKKLKLNNQARAKLEFYYAITKLSEYGTMRKFLSSNKQDLTQKQVNYLTDYYLNNLSMTDIANNYMVTRQAVQKTIKKTIKDNNVVWKIFVKKQGNKVVYNNQELL